MYTGTEPPLLVLPGCPGEDGLALSEALKFNLQGPGTSYAGSDDPETLPHQHQQNFCV